MILPTQDKELKDRLVRMFDNATDFFEWTNSKRVVHERHEIVVTEILREFEKRGYHIGLPTNLVENPIHGIKCVKCQRILLYGSKVYEDKKEVYCFKCGKEIKIKPADITKIECSPDDFGVSQFNTVRAVDEYFNKGK